MDLIDGRGGVPFERRGSLGICAVDFGGASFAILEISQKNKTRGSRVLKQRIMLYGVGAESVLSRRWRCWRICNEDPLAQNQAHQAPPHFKLVPRSITDHENVNLRLASHSCRCAQERRRRVSCSYSLSKSPKASSNICRPANYHGSSTLSRKLSHR